MSHDSAGAVATLRGLTARFDNSVRSANTFYPQLATTVPSGGADEEYGILGRVPAVREWLGDRKFQTLRGAKWTITNKKFELSLGIEKDHIADDRLGLYGPILAQMGIRAAKHPDRLMFTLINDAESGACFDGQYFFDTDHSWGDSGTQSNDLTYNASDHTAVTSAEFKLAYNAAVQALMLFKDDQNELLNDDLYDEQQQIIVVVHPTLLQVARDALSVRTVSTGGENYVITQPNIRASGLYTATTKFDVYKVDEPLRPYIFQAREPLSRQMKNQNDLEYKDVKFMTQARYNVGYGAWWTGVRTTFN